MAGKFSFRLQRAEPRRDFPSKLIIGQQETETPAHVLMKALAYLLFFRERLQIDVNLHMDSIPFRPDVVQLDYEMRPRVVGRMRRVHRATSSTSWPSKCPRRRSGSSKSSLAAAEELLRAMGKAGLRRQRYRLIGLDDGMVEEMSGLLRSREMRSYWVQRQLRAAVASIGF